MNDTQTTGHVVARRIPLRHLAVLGVAVLLPLAALPARAEEPAPGKVLKVCQDSNNLPFANEKGEGFENRIAELFGKSLGLPVEYYSLPQRFNFVRNSLRYRLPGSDYRCDVMLGVPAGYEQVAATKPYYRSTYALVLPAEGKFKGVENVDDFYARAKELGKKGFALGLYDKSPASAWVARHDLVEDAKVYPMMSPNPDDYSGQIIEKELREGRIDAAVVWGPIAGFYASRIKEPAMRVVPLRSETGVQFDYAMAMGVRRGEPQWKATVQKFIDENQPALQDILRSYGVPLVDDQGNPVR